MSISTSQSPPRRRTARTSRVLAVATATFALVLAAPLAASAHIHVEPGTAKAGAERAELTFAVPTESAKAVTSVVRVTLPTATPFAYASVQQVAGWRSAVTTAKLPKPVEVGGARVTEAPVAVTWTALPGTQLADGEFQAFTVAVGAVPDVGRLALPVTQTYSDGTVVRWNEPTPASGEEPEHPAPVLFVNDSPPSGDDAASVTPTASTIDTLGIALGGAALVVALAALVLALGAVLRGRRRPVR